MISKDVLKATIVMGAISVIIFTTLYVPLRGLKLENEALRNSLASKEAVIERLQRQIDSLSGMLQNVTLENEDLKLNLETYKGLYLNATEEIQELNMTIEDLNWQIKALEEELDYYRKLKIPELTSLQHLMDFTTLLMGKGNYTYLVTFRNASVIQISDYPWSRQNTSVEYLYLYITSQQATAEIINFHGLMPFAFLYVSSGDYFYYHAERQQDGAITVTIRMENVTLTDGMFVPYLDLKVQVEAPE